MGSARFLPAALLLLVGGVGAQQRHCRPDDVITRSGSPTGESSEWRFQFGDCIVVNLAHKALGDAGAAALSHALAGNSLVTTLTLAGNGIGNAGATALAGLIRASGTLKSLDLRRNEIGDAGATAIQGALPGGMASASRLDILDMRSNPMGPSALALGTAVGGRQCGIKEFNKVNPNPMRCSIVSPLCPTVILTPCGDSPFRQVPVAQLRMEDPSLTSLSFVRLNIGNAGVAALGQTLKHTLRLTSLELGDNSEIGEVGYVWLAEALRYNKGLTSVTFHGNTIGAGHKMALEAAVACNRAAQTNPKQSSTAARTACKDAALRLMHIKQEL